MNRKNFSALIALIALAFVVGCSSLDPPEALQPVPHKSGFTGFATLASSGTFEFATAPAWTRLAQLRHNAAAALRVQKISVATAREIQARADLVRTLIEDAIVADRSGDVVKAKDKLAWATAGLDDAEIKLKGKP